MKFRYLFPLLPLMAASCATSHGQKTFRKLDTNRDHKVTEAEFVSHVNGEAFRVLDKDGDGKVTKAEWTEKEARKTSATLFKAMDRNRDGTLSAAEFAPAPGSRKHDELKGTFRTLDRNGDGGLEWDEVTDSKKS